MNKLEKIKDLKNFYLFAIGQFVSQFGSKMTSYGLVLWSYKESGSVLVTSTLAVCYLIPEIFLSFIAGGISDKWNKKKIMLTADSAAAVFSFVILILLILGKLKIEYLYAANFFLGVGDAFQNPASETVISIIVSKENYIKTSGIRSFFNSVIVVFAPVAAVSVYAFMGLKFIIIVDLLTFVFAFLSLALWVKIPDIPFLHKKSEKIYKECLLGLKYLFNRKDILSLIYFMGFINFVAGMYDTGLAPMILSRTGGNDIQLGIVTSSIGISGILGSFIVSKVHTTKRASLMINIMVFSFLICNIMLGIGRNYYIWTAAVLMGHFFVPLLLANMEYIMRTKVPLEMHGKVFSARNTIQYASLPLGNLLCGFLADSFFEPYMYKDGIIQSYIRMFTGKGAGSGLALMYIFLGLLGFAGCLLFKKNKNFKKLDE